MKLKNYIRLAGIAGELRGMAVGMSVGDCVSNATIENLKRLTRDISRIVNDEDFDPLDVYTPAKRSPLKNKAA